MVEQNIDDILKQVRLVRTEEAIVDLVNDRAQFSIGVVVVPGIVALLLQGHHLVFVHAKDEDVLLAHLLHHLHISTIQSANGKAAI